MHSPEKIFSSFFGPFCSFQWEISVKAHIYWHLSQKSTPFVKKVRKTNKKRLIIEFKKLEIITSTVMKNARKIKGRN